MPTLALFKSVERPRVPDLKLPDVDPELCSCLGQIIIAWSTVEYLVSILLGTFLSADLGGMMVITNNIAVSTQSKWLRALMATHEHEAEHNTRVINLLNRADDLRSERNEFVHGTWSTIGCEPKTALVETVNLERAEIIKSRLVTLSDLKELRAEIETWINDYVALGRELGFPRHKGQTKSIFAD
jgi:hypothetical protein